MPKTKPPRRSRLIRKWDGTAVTDAEAEVKESNDVEVASAELPAKDRRTEEEELIFDFEREAELSDSMDR